MSNNLTVKILEVSGLTIAARYVGLPVGKVRSRGEALHENTGNLTRESVSRLNKLIAKGDKHTEIMRQVVVHMEITGPIYWWTQFATYEIGREMYSGSTMHTLMRGVENKDFTCEVMDDTRGIVEYFTTDESQRDLIYAKANLPGGYLQTRLVMVSYTTLRRIWLQRRKHRLSEWHELIESMQELPHCDDLIFVEPKNPWRDLWVEWFDFDGEPWLYDAEQVATFCVFCGNNKEYGHDDACVYARIKRLLDKEAK